MGRLLQDGPAEQAQRRPEASALVMEDETLTYGQLESDSNRLARLLRKAGCAHGDRVALLLPKSPTAMVAILAVLKAGGIYVPVDPGNPPARAARILARSGARFVLACRASKDLLAAAYREEGLRQAPLLGWLDREAPAEDLPLPVLAWHDLATQSETPPDRTGASSDAAHLLFTSGSTGEPKGVVITHDNVLHFIDWAIPYFGIGPSDRHSSHPPLHFDLSTFDIHGTLSAGARLYLVRPELSLLPAKLADFIRRFELTQWFSVPSVLTYMAKFDAVGQGDFPSLRRLLWCGEVFPTPALVHWMRRLPHVTFTNLYGPTEATIASSHYTLPACPARETDPVPIGRACPGEELLVLDEARQPVPPGEIGDLYIGGVGLSPGYWEDPEKTAGAFVPHPGDAGRRIYRTGDLARMDADGLATYVGRTDSQIKSRGYRIELGEIETALSVVPGVLESAVVAVDLEGFEGHTICCAYVLADGQALPAARLRAALSSRLPAYMLPSRWMTLPSLPKNANGKIDRRRLRESFAAERETGAVKP